MYPHQVLMDEHKLSKTDLSQEAQEYLTDFNHYHRGISLKESRAIKAGKEFILSDSENNKLNRFSKSVALKIYEDLKVREAAKKVEEDKEIKIKEEARELAKQQLEEEARIKAENQAKKEKEEKEEEERKLQEAEKEKLQLVQEEEERKLQEEEQRLEEQILEEQILEEERLDEERLKERELRNIERDKRAVPPPKKQDKGTGLFDYFF